MSTNINRGLFIGIVFVDRKIDTVADLPEPSYYTAYFCYKLSTLSCGSSSWIHGKQTAYVELIINYNIKIAFFVLL